MSVIRTLASMENPLFSQASMSAAASTSSRRCMRNHRITRRRTRSVSAARSAYSDRHPRPQATWLWLRGVRRGSYSSPSFSPPSNSAGLVLSIRTQSLAHGLRNLKPHSLDRLGEFRTIACRNRTNRVMDEPNVKGCQLHQPHSRWFRKTGDRPIVELHVEGIPRLMSRDPSQQEVAGVARQHNSRPTLSALHVREGKLHGHNNADPRCCHRRRHRANRP